MDDDQSYRAFVRAIADVNEKLVGLLEKDPIREHYHVPANREENKALLRSIADEVMLCGDIDAVLKRIMANKATALILITHSTEVEEAYAIAILKRAFAARPTQSKILPGQAYATYLLQIVEDWPPAWTQDFRDWASSL